MERKNEKLSPCPGAQSKSGVAVNHRAPRIPNECISPAVSISIHAGLETAECIQGVSPPEAKRLLGLTADVRSVSVQRPSNGNTELPGFSWNDLYPN